MSIKSLHYEVKMDVGRRDASLAKTASDPRTSAVFASGKGPFHNVLLE